MAGGFADRMVLVGADSVAAFDLADGKAAWTHSLQPSEGRPCGRGVATDDHYHLPLSSGQICTLGLSDGKLASRTYLPESAEGGAVLGNLVMSRGLVLALGPEGLTAFEQREALEIRRLWRYWGCSKQPAKFASCIPQSVEFHSCRTGAERINQSRGQSTGKILTSVDYPNHVWSWDFVAD